MRQFNSRKIFVQFRDGIMPDTPIEGRKYTITHSDKTGELFVFIAKNYANDQITRMRDEVKIEWIEAEEGPVLLGEVAVSGKGIVGNPAIRNKIFYSEMPKALQALRVADRFLFDKYPDLDKTPVKIRFISPDPKYNQVYDFGIIGDYQLPIE